MRRHISLTLTGTLGLVRACMGGRDNAESVLVFEIDGGHGWPLEARWFLGHDFAGAHRVAGALHRGDRVTVIFGGLRTRTDFGAATITLNEVERIECRETVLAR